MVKTRLFIRSAYGYVDGDEDPLSEYKEIAIDPADVSFAEDGTSVTVRVSSEILTVFADYIAENGYIGIDWYGTSTFFGVTGSASYLTSTYVLAPAAETAEQA